MQTTAFYYDGESSARREVSLTLEGEVLRLRGPALDLYFPLSGIRLSPCLGSAPRSLYLPAGALCEFADKAFAAHLERRQGRGGFSRGLHRWESNLMLALTALAATIAVLWLFIQFGLPALAKRAAYAIPPATEVTLGAETLKILDHSLFEPTVLSGERQAELRTLFAGIVADLGATERTFELEFRRSPHLGANALALPGGRVILTDDLEKLAGHDEEIAAVLAHEIGHILHRHALRQVIQDSTASLLVATLTGDVFSATSLAAALPTMLVDAKFSRDMEREADDVAAAYLRQEGISVERFSAILARLRNPHGESDEAGKNEGDSFTDYLSTHPATDERIERLRNGGR
jgi:Zn-dependent protease with chaperone function